jgi:hypothetical protein
MGGEVEYFFGVDKAVYLRNDPANCSQQFKEAKKRKLEEVETAAEAEKEYKSIECNRRRGQRPRRRVTTVLTRTMRCMSMGRGCAKMTS